MTVIEGWIDIPMDNSRESDKGQAAVARLVPAAEIKSRRQDFLWSPQIPVGTVTLFAGRGGVGKSTFAIWLAVEAQHGRLAGDFENRPVKVAWYGIEDSWETQMKPKLIAAGADLKTFYRLTMVSEVDVNTGERTPVFPADLVSVRRAVEEEGITVLFVDPLTSTLQGDDHKRDVVRQMVDPLATMAQEMGIVVIGLMHFNKGMGATSDKMSGSHAFRDAARSVLLFAMDDETRTIVVSQDKSNYAETDGSSLEFALESVTVPLDDGKTAEVARVRIVGKTSTSVDQIINRSGPVNRSEAAVWLQDFMRAAGGDVSAQDALTAGEALGFNKQKVQRARAAERIFTYKHGLNGGWRWSLAAPGAESPLLSRDAFGGGAEGGRRLRSSRAPSGTEDVGLRPRKKRRRRRPGGEPPSAASTTP